MNQQQTELDDLKSKLQLKNDAFDDMKKETDIYKQQYEGLLEEYQQYLQDLESLQVKSDGLERWKTLYENEISDLKSAAIKQDEALEEANSKISALNEKEEERSRLSQVIKFILQLRFSISRKRYPKWLNFVHTNIPLKVRTASSMPKRKLMYRV